jgi:hypothetical protein
VGVEATHGGEHDRAGAVGNLNVAELEGLEDSLAEAPGAIDGHDGHGAISFSAEQ